MNISIAARLLNLLTHLLDPLQPVLLLATRWYVSWQFLKSGWLKASSWPGTLDLFREEYQVPLLPPELAAVVGTAGELVFPILLIVGVGGRIGALGLFAVNLLAVISYAHVLLAEGFEAALAQHVLWGYMLLMLAVFGNGRFAVDSLLDKSMDRTAMAHGAT